MIESSTVVTCHRARITCQMEQRKNYSEHKINKHHTVTTMEDIDNPEGIPVILVNKFNKTQELKRKIVKTKDGKIPLKDLCNEWCMSNVYWHDDGVNEKINIDKNGYSDIKFSFISEIVLMADQITGFNQQVKAAQHMNQSVTVANSGKNASNAPKKPIDIEVTTVQDNHIHANVQRMNAFTSLVNRSKMVANQSASSPSSQQTTAPVVSKPVVFTPPKTTPTVVVAPAKPAASTGSGSSGGNLDDLIKLAELRDKGILSEEEFAQKKKQILGL